MINIETLEISGFKGAILGMRNPMKSRDKSDSVFDQPAVGACLIGLKDLELCQKLIRAGGDDDAKFMRMIHVQADITAPLYWWKEYVTNKVATTENSESTMHTIHAREIVCGDFSFDMLLDDYTIDEDWEIELTPDQIMEQNLDAINMCRKLYLKAREEGNAAKAYDYWYNMIQMLPDSYIQMRTVDLNYQTLRRLYFARRHHKLKEWHEFCDWIQELPYAQELIAYEPPKEFPGFDLEKFYKTFTQFRGAGLTDAEICERFCMKTLYFRELKKVAFEKVGGQNDAE